MILMLAALLSVTATPTAAGKCDGSTREVETCLAGELRQADAELNRYYRAAVDRLTGERQPAALAQLRRSEAAWIGHRDAECGAVWEYWREGSIRGTVATQCRIRLTRGRTVTIWRNWLTYADSTPSLLPTPTEPD